jgi:hypothetical protein
MAKLLHETPPQRNRFRVARIAYLLAHRGMNHNELGRIDENHLATGIDSDSECPY